MSLPTSKGRVRSSQTLILVVCFDPSITITVRARYVVRAIGVAGVHVRVRHPTIAVADTAEFLRHPNHSFQRACSYNGTLAAGILWMFLKMPCIRLDCRYRRKLQLWPSFIRTSIIYPLLGVLPVWTTRLAIVGTITRVRDGGGCQRADAELTACGRGPRQCATVLEAAGQAAATSGETGQPPRGLDTLGERPVCQHLVSGSCTPLGIGHWMRR
jgi:hypothetical protein